MNYYGGAYINRGIRVSVHSPWVNRLLFEDGSLIFMNAKVESANRLNDILRIYAACSGHAVNWEKSAVYFSPNALPPLRAEIK